MWNYCAALFTFWQIKNQNKTKKEICVHSHVVPSLLVIKKKQNLQNQNTNNRTKQNKKITLTYLQRKTEMFPISSTGDLGTPWHPCISDKTQNCLRALGLARLLCIASFIIWQCARLFPFSFLTASTYKFFIRQHILVLPLQWECRVEALPWSAKSCSVLPWTSFQADTNSVGR